MKSNSVIKLNSLNIFVVHENKWCALVMECRKRGAWKSRAASRARQRVERPWRSRACRVRLLTSHTRAAYLTSIHTYTREILFRATMKQWPIKTSTLAKSISHLKIVTKADLLEEKQYKLSGWVWRILVNRLKAPVNEFGLPTMKTEVFTAREV